MFRQPMMPGRAPPLPALSAILTLAAALTIATWLVLLVAHLGDLYRVDHAGGIWASMALFAADGVLYPPLFEGGPQGSRYMPLPILGHTVQTSAESPQSRSPKLPSLERPGWVGIG